VPVDHFDERVAARYDTDSAALFDPGVVDATVTFLAALAGTGRALELGIGTGRIAVPLHERGVPVHGIDLRRRWWRGCGPSRAPPASA
jgi:2-polyprenyl-3-methyl-5-hydroxy-6-metoxy-1,4-benzoquinol methylase